MFVFCSSFDITVDLEILTVTNVKDYPVTQGSHSFRLQFAVVRGVND